MNKTIIQAGAALATVVGLYTAPWMLGFLTQGGPTFEVFELPVDRPAVVWMPMERPETEAPDAEALSLEEPVATETAAVTDVAEVADADLGEPEAVQELAAPAPPDARPRVVRKRRLRPRRVAKTPVKKAAKRPLTKKQQRRRKKWSKKQDRLAKQVQCADHIDQILKIGETDTSDEWLVGEDLVRCYRAHPQQFMNMGGMSWAEEGGKKVGLKIYVSNRDRGLVARTVGFQRGDILRSFNGLSLRNHATVTLALTQLTRSKAKLKYLRNGEKRIFKVQVVDEERIEEARLEQIAIAEAAAAEKPKPRRTPKRPRSGAHR